MNIRVGTAIFLIICGTTGVAWFVYQEEIADLVHDAQENGLQTTLEHTVDNLFPITREVITPPPLRGPLTQREVILTADGVFQFTNQQRQTQGLTTLARNTTLDAAAQNKVDDMFARQYFEHESPTGEGPADVVDGVGYSYIRVGENLALGNFESDEALVQAWMDSPGHRANILDSGFQEIGIAASVGTFEGQRVWLAVQTFATSSTVCVMPSQDLLTSIETQKAALNTLSTSIESERDQLDTRAAEIETLFVQAQETVEAGNKEIQKGNTIYKQTGDKEQAQPYWDRGEQLQEEGKQLQQKAVDQQAQHQQDLNAFNMKVASLNEKASALEIDIEAYNQQVQTSNTCIEGFGR